MKNSNHVRIHTLVPHPVPHLDEVGQAVIALEYGAGHFGIDRDFKVAPEWITDKCLDECMAEGKLPLGQLKGEMDDKDARGQRIEGMCSSLRMAQYLKVSDRPELDHIISEILRLDGTGTANRMDLSKLIKMGNDTKPASFQPTMFKTAMKAVKVLIAYKRAGWEKAPEFKLDLIQFFRDRYPDIAPKVRSEIERNLKGQENCTDLFGLPYIAGAMRQIGQSNEDVEEFLMFAVDLLVTDQIVFGEALVELSEKNAVKSIRRLFTPWTDKTYEMVIVHSENPNVAKAARAMFGAAVVVVRRQSGNVSIMLNVQAGLEYSMLRALIRIYEATPNYAAVAKLSLYERTGCIPQVKNWFMEKSFLLNGSLHIPAEPTRISDEELTNAIMLAFSFKGVELFFRKKNLARKKISPEIRKEPSKKSQNIPTPEESVKAVEELFVQAEL